MIWLDTVLNIPQKVGSLALVADSFHMLKYALKLPLYRA